MRHHLRTALALLSAFPALPASIVLAQTALSPDQQDHTRMAAQVQQVRMITSKLPRVDVTHGDFSVGCANAADAAGHADSTCAIRNAIAYAKSNPIRGGGYPAIYFPHGVYRVAGQGLTAALTLDAGISLVGDGAQSSTILNVSPSAGTVAYNNANECAGKPGPCFIRIEGLTFSGLGHSTMGGLVEINSTSTGLMDDVVLADTGGIALNLQGSSERWSLLQVEIDHARWALLAEGDTNEDYFERVNVIDSGGDGTGFCFSVNCPGGHLIQSGTWMADPHSAVFLDGDNLHWMDSSIKSTAYIGGLRMAAVTSSVAHTYFEGFAWGGQPRTNHAVELGGKLELGHLTSGIGAHDLEIAVDDAGWQPLYVNDPALAHINGEHAYTPYFGIFPADYQYKSTEPSRAVPGVSRGTMEWIRVASFAGDGRAHAIARAQNGSASVAWPAGSIIEQAPPKGYGTARIEENHFNSLDYDPHAKYASGCDDTAPLARWTSSPSRLCAEIIVGLVPDGYMIPPPSTGFIAPEFDVAISDNTIFYGGDEANGEGWIKVPANGNVTLDQGDRPLASFTSADTALFTYVNGSSHVQVVKWGTGAALAVVHDQSAGVRFSPQDHYFRADVRVNNSMSHEYLGEECWYPIQAGDAQPTSRFCMRASGAAQERLVNGRWMGAAH